MFQKLWITNVFFLLLSSMSYGQISYFNYIDHTSQWHVRSEAGYADFSCSATFVTESVDSWLYLMGDTLIQGNWYYKMYKHDKKSVTCAGNTTYTTATNSFGFLREDATKKFYWHNGYSESILWDFDMTVGTVVDPSCTIVSTGSVTLGAQNLSTFDCGCSVNNLVIEGVGSLSGLFNTFFCAIGIEANSSLVCYKKQNDILVVDTSYNCTFPIVVSGNQLPKEKEPLAIDVYPNPVYGTVNIVLEALKNGGKAEVVIFNSLGQSIHYGTLNQVTSILDISTIPLGVYSLRVTTGKTQITKQIIKG